MSYSDDEEIKIGELAEEDDDLDLDGDIKDLSLDDDLILEDEEEIEGFAGLDGSEY